MEAQTEAGLVRAGWVVVALSLVGSLLIAFTVSSLAADAVAALERARAQPPETPTAPDQAVVAPTQETPVPAVDAWVVTHVVDGDTLDATRDGVTERVRVVGIDTPERGECGFSEATEALAQMVQGAGVQLVPGAQDERDRYGRLLAYVDVVGTDPVDAGLSLIAAGYAIARYDSRDGYGPHPREGAYVTADLESGPAAGCARAAPAVVEAPVVAGSGVGAGACDPAYPGVCIPAGPPDLDCGGVPFRDFRVLAPDPHGFDADGDGLGCVS